MNPDAMAPFGLALLACFRGDSEAQLLIRRDDGKEDRLPMSLFFRAAAEFTPIEVAALDRCRGHVLDIGAGSGVHSLFLQAHGKRVTAIDIDPRAVRVMKERGVQDPQRADVLEYDGGPFDTLLMLGHGVGMVEDLAGLSRFLDVARRLMGGDGRLLLHSLDVTRTRDPEHLSYHEANQRAGRYAGEIRMRFEYDGKRGPYCGWLHVDPRTLKRHAERAGWSMETVVAEESGDYLASLAPNRTSSVQAEG
jgi:SAM-dependent methyltransferase